MIAYVQEQTSAHWLSKVNGWIQDLAKEAGCDWSRADFLRLLDEDPKVGVCRLASQHRRQGELEPIDIQHLWVKMN